MSVNITHESVITNEQCLSWRELAKRLYFKRRIGGEYTLGWYQLYVRLDWYYYAIHGNDLTFAPNIKDCSVKDITGYFIQANSEFQQCIFTCPKPVEENTYIFLYASRQMSAGVCTTKMYHLVTGINYKQEFSIDIGIILTSLLPMPLIKHNKLFFYFKLVNAVSGWSGNRLYMSCLID